MKTIKTNKIIELTYERKHANIKTGAILNITLPQARGFYKLTHLIPNEDDNYSNLLMCRDIVRSIAKAILFAEGETDSPESFVSSLHDEDIPENEMDAIGRASVAGYQDDGESI